ncbi:MAG TPA: glycosyltransferase family 39 protein [Candidatus Eisenbacteria bacterium]
MIQRVDPRVRRAALPAGRPSASWLPMFLVALALRVAYAWLATGPGAQPFSDPAEYDTVAWNLTRGHGFALDGASGPYPTAFVPPLLPWVTSLLYGAVGHRYFAAILLQCVFGALIPLALTGFGSAMYGGTTGRLAGWIAALDPLLVFFSGYLLTESLFTLTLVLALLASASWVKTPRAGRALGTGLAWGIAALARPTALALPAFVAAWAWGPLGLALVVGPWTVRNALVLRAFVPVTTGGGRALLDGNNDAGWSDPELRGGAAGGAWQALAAGELRGLAEPEVDARARAHAVTFLRAHAREWPAMALAKLARFWRLSAEGGGTGTWQRPGSALGPVLRVLDPLRLWSLALFPLAAWGAWLLARAPRRWFQSLSVWVVLYFTAIGVVFFGSLRMRLPAQPMIVLLGAAGLDDLRRRLRSRARGLRVVEGKR